MMGPRSEGCCGVIFVLSNRWRGQVVFCEVSVECMRVCVGCSVLCGVSGS